MVNPYDPLWGNSAGPLENVIVQCLGYDYDRWESVQIEVSMQTAIVQATLTTTEAGPFLDSSTAIQEWNFPPGSLVEIYASGDIVFSGVVFQYIPSADANQHSITLVCRTRTYDFVVSSVKSETGQYQNTTDVAMMAGWAMSHGARLFNLSTEKIIDWWQVKVGATNWSESMRLIADSGKMLFADPLGNLILSDGMPFKMSGTLIQGVNIEAMSAMLQDTEFATHEVVGQSPNGTTLNQFLTIHQIAVNTLASPYRYKKIIDQAASNDIQALARANWERNRGASDAMQATIVSPGWRDLDGALWMINQDVYVNAPWLHINCVLRTYRVVLMQNLQQGSVTQLTLLDPRAVSGPAYTGTITPCASGDLWSVGWNAAESVVNTVASTTGTAAKVAAAAKSVVDAAAAVASTIPKL